MKKITLLLIVFANALLLHAQSSDTLQLYLDSIESRLTYQHGEITLANGIGKLQVPKNFRYLDAEQSTYVLHDLWGNPGGTATLGMIVPENVSVMADNSWAFIITYDEMGYVEDDDADEIDYDELLEEMQGDTKTENEERSELGFEPITLVGWAAKPFYDREKKVLHWAKELKFGETENNTLNYNVRILGRKGVLVMNAVASMTELSEVQQSIPQMLSSFSFSEGMDYGDFNPDIDEVAAWTVGGLVAGKVLAKVGVLAFLLKYIKLIIIGVGAAATGAWKWYKRKTELPTVRNISDETPS
jgi:uncharacterized membrane-anchored protein